MHRFRLPLPHRSRRVASSVIGLALLVPAGVVASGPSGAAGASAATAPASAVASPGDEWAWPVGPPVQLVAPFRAPPTPYAAGHRGIDLAARPGDAVRAADDGVVAFAGPVAGRGVVSIDHGDGIVSAIEPVAASAAVGDRVARGEQVGVVAGGGHCDASCVHFGVRVHGEYVSPLIFLGGVPRAVLLPMPG